MTDSLPILIPQVEKTPLELFKESQKIGSAITANSSDYLKKARSATGNQVTSSSAAILQEAASYRLNVATVFDVHTPAHSVNCNQGVFQAKTFNAQVFHNQLSFVNTFTRAQNISVIEAKCQYNYSSREHLTGAPEMLNQASRNFTFGDYVKIQSGQANQQRVSSLDVGSNYGCLDIGAIKKVVIKSDLDSITLDAHRNLNLFSKGPARLRSKDSLVLSSKRGTIVKSGEELVLDSGGNMIISSGGMLSFSTTGGLNLDANMINVAMGGSWRPSFNLESLAFASEIGEQILAGDFTSFLQVPEELNEYSEGFIKALPEEVFSSGVVQAASSSLLGAFNPTNIRSYLDAFDPEQAVGNVFSSIVGANLGEFGPFVQAAIPGLHMLGQTVSDFTEASYTFDVYPKLKEDLEPYQTIAVPSNKSYVQTGGSVFADFNSIYRTDPPQIPTDVA